MCYFPAALVQPPLPIAQDTMKDVPFPSLVLPVGTVTSNLATPTLSAGSVFNPLPVNKPESDEKGSHLTDLQISSSENNRSGKKSFCCHTIPYRRHPTSEGFFADHSSNNYIVQNFRLSIIFSLS